MEGAFRDIVNGGDAFEVTWRPIRVINNSRGTLGQTWGAIWVVDNVRCAERGEGGGGRAWSE